METPEYTVGPYRDLGLIADPFLNHRNRETESLAMALEIQAQTNRLIASIDMAAAAPRGATIWVEKSDQVHGSYHRAALIETEKTLLQDDDLNVLHAYVPLFAAKVGRIRSVLNVVAERLSTRSFDRTLAAWLEPYIDAPDTELSEWGAVEGEAWQEFASAFKADPIEALASVFGPNVMFRQVEMNPPIDLRPANLEEEPEETDASPEDDERTAVIPEPLQLDENGAPIEDVVDVPDAVYLYLIALARKTLSPVIARGMRVYASRGAAPMSDELKITKAPRKTLKALVEFAALRFRKVAIVFDGYDNWNLMPEELRAKYVGALSEMRLLLGSKAIMVFLANTDEASELDEMFGGGTRVVWAFPVLPRAKDAAAEEDIIASWIADATLPGATPAISAHELLATFGEAAAGDLVTFCRMAAAAVESMVSRSAAGFDDEAKAAGLAAASVA